MEKHVIYGFRSCRIFVDSVSFVFYGNFSERIGGSGQYECRLWESFGDHVAGWILELDRGEGIPWKGNYSSWLEQKTKRMEMEEKVASKRRKTLERELDWVRMAPKARQAKGKARLNSYDKLLNEDVKEKEEKLEIFIPNGPRLGNKVIEAKGVAKAYGDKLLFDNLNFMLPPNGIVGVIGPNGAGKTTCMRMIGGLAKPTSGEISMFGYAGKDLSKVRSRVGCLIEAPGVYPNMTAKENIEMKCRLFGISKKGYAEGILDKVGLLNVGKKKTKNFSLGMKQRLGIGMALVGEPDLLVLDEPINGLDPQGIAEVRDTIQNLCAQQDMTVFISSHILEELSKLATDYGIINNGALLQEITREELLSKCSEKITLTVDNPNKAVPVLDKMGFVHYMIVDKNHIDVYERLNDSAALNTALVTAGVSVAQLAVTGMELETYFLSITGGATNV